MCSASGHDCGRSLQGLRTSLPTLASSEDRKTRLRRHEMYTVRTICAQNMQKCAPHLSNQSYTPPHSWLT